MQKRLIQLMLLVAPELKVDQSVHSPCQVMRLPGGLHPERKERTKVQSISCHVCKLAALEAVLTPLEVTKAAIARP